MKRSSPLVAVAAGCLAIAPASASAAPVAASSHLDKISGYGQRIVYSQFDASDRRFYLAIATARTPLAPPVRLKVRSRLVPFDVDLGPGPDGTPVAVYSTCATEPSIGAAEAEGQLLDYSTAGGCKLYEYSLATHREQALTQLAHAGESQTLPTIWRTGFGPATIV